MRMTPMCKEITPATGRILVEPITTEAKSAGGIVLHGEQASQFTHGKVLAVGAGKVMPNGNRIDMDVTVGDVVIYGGMQNTVEDELNGVPVLLVVEAAIVAIIKE